MSNIEVSVITPMYNASPWLPGLFETTRRQSFQGFEHLLVDDCSTDGSAEEALRLCAGVLHKAPLCLWQAESWRRQNNYTFV